MNREQRIGELVKTFTKLDLADTLVTQADKIAELEAQLAQAAWQPKWNEYPEWVRYVAKMPASRPSIYLYENVPDADGQWQSGGWYSYIDHLWKSDVEIFERPQVKQ